MQTVHGEGFHVGAIPVHTCELHYFSLGVHNISGIGVQGKGGRGEGKRNGMGEDNKERTVCRNVWLSTLCLNGMSILSHLPDVSRGSWEFKRSGARLATTVAGRMLIRVASNNTHFGIYAAFIGQPSDKGKSCS